MAQLRDTNIEGNLTVTGSLINQGVDVSAKIDSNLQKFKNMFCTAPKLQYTVAAGSGYTINDSAVYLIGNRLLLAIYATRSSASGVGNITNETIATFTITHNGKIADIFNASGVSYITGAYATYTTAINSLGDTTAKVAVKVSGTNAAMTAFRTRVLLTCELDPKAY